MYNEHYPSILVTFGGETEHFSGRIGALRWSILVGKQKHNVQKPNARLMFGTRDLVWPGYASSRELYLRSREYDFTKDKKENKSPNKYSPKLEYSNLLLVGY